MTLAEDCVFAALVLYLLTLAPIKVLGHREFDNANPRSVRFYRSNLRARALGAHNNGIETFPFFLGAVLLAEFRHGPQAWIDGLAMAFVALRVAYIGAYMIGRSTLRTLIWNAAFFANAAIFFLPAFRR
jgi:uncharacterized MAPEG superfamily protein